MENGYLYVVLSLASVALASFVTYDSERLRESRFALAVILFASLSLPLVSAVKGISDIDFDYSYEIGPSSAVTEAVEDAFSLGIAQAVRDEFSIKKDDISVTVGGFDSEKMRAVSIFVTLSGRAAFMDLGAIEDFVDGLGLGKCVLEVSLG